MVDDGVVQAPRLKRTIRSPLSLSATPETSLIPTPMLS
ncbi:hypothetical protein SynMITS9220_01957 [Synechococcus sp. MIT S9220]|nr:hypothetical protein SynMITS9220_01957 [Synechococcus sp. MIT S9220]